MDEATRQLLHDFLFELLEHAGFIIAAFFLGRLVEAEVQRVQHDEASRRTPQPSPEDDAP